MTRAKAIMKSGLLVSNLSVMLNASSWVDVLIVGLFFDASSSNFRSAKVSSMNRIEIDTKPPVFESTCIYPPILKPGNGAGNRSSFFSMLGHPGLLLF